MLGSPPFFKHMKPIQIIKVVPGWDFKPGDVVETALEGVGTMRHRFV